MEWFEELPKDCPPKEAFSPGNSFYRIGSIPPADNDFWSHRKRFPYRFFQVSECVAHSLSVFDDREAVERLQRLLPAMRGKPLLKLDLIASDGMIQQTGNDPHHFSWWRSTQFDLQTIKIVG
jgi:hypothetical protein